jgi:hypothetical protein
LSASLGGEEFFGHFDRIDDDNFILALLVKNELETSHKIAIGFDVDPVDVILVRPAFEVEDERPGGDGCAGFSGAFRAVPELA